MQIPAGFRTIPTAHTSGSYRRSYRPSFALRGEPALEAPCTFIQNPAAKLSAIPNNSGVLDKASKLVG
jgi:hypothetical protein